MNKLSVDASPHLQSHASSAKIMLCVLLALLPAAITGCLNFGRHAVLIITVTTGSAMFFEFFSRTFLRRQQTAQDLSAAVTGLILGMSLPPDLPLWQAVIGSFFAIVAVKQLFGGIGKNFVNPAAAAWIFMLLLFHSDMTALRIPQTETVISINALSGRSDTYWDMLLGNTAGSIGQTCALGLLLGAIFLWISGIISPAASLADLLSFALLSWVYGGDPAAELLSGSLMLAACFMVNDYTTAPLTRIGKVIFGAGCGVLTFFIQNFGGYPDGAIFAVVMMNLLTPVIDKLTAVSPFGAMKTEPTSTEFKS